MLKEELYQMPVELPKAPKPEKEALISDTENNDIEYIQPGDKEISEDQAEDKIKQKLRDFLIAEGVIMEKDGKIIVDSEKLNGGGFKNNLWNLSLGRSRRDHTHIKGTLKLISEKFGDLDAISLADYEKEKREGAEARPSKLLLKEQIFSGTNREKILHIMKQEKVLEEIDGYNVIDIKNFSAPGFINNNIKHHKYVRNRQAVSGGQKLVFEELADLPVVSRDEFMEAREKGYAIKPKPLFNVPASLDEALDIAKARKKNYHLNFWDMGSSIKQQTPWQVSLKLKNGDEIGVSEWGLFTKIFVDHQGKRADDGTIKVFNEKKQNFVRASSEWINVNIGSVGGGVNKGIGDNPHRFLLDRCPNLIEKGLIRIEDFKIITNSRSGYLLRKEFPMNAATHNAMINSVAYYIGRDKFIYENFSLPMENVKIAVLDNNLAGIIKVNKGREQLLFTLSLLNKEEKEKKRQGVINKRKDMSRKDITSNTIVNARDVRERIQPYRPTRDNPIRQGEAVEDYAERIRYLGDYENLKEISDDFSKQCLIGIHNLTWREQQWLCGAAYDLGYKDYHRLLEFGKNYGLAGLKTFLSCEHDINNSGKILSLGDQFKHSPEAADLLFSEYAQLADKTETAAEEMSRLYNEIFFEKQIDKNQVMNAILNRASQLLVDAEEKLKNTPENDKQALVKELVEELVKEQMAQKRMLDDFKNIALNLNKEYLNYRLYDTTPTVSDSKLRELAAEIKESELEKFKKETNYNALDHAFDAKEMLAHINYCNERFYKYDSNKLIKEIEYLKNKKYFLQNKIENSINLSRDTINSRYISHEDEKKRKSFIELDKQDLEELIKKIKNIEKLFSLQHSLEQKMDQIIYGKKQNKNEQNLDQSLPAMILDKYQELVGLTNKSKKELAGLFKKEVDLEQTDLDNINGDILLKAKECINNFNELIEKGEEVNETEILKKLEKYQTDVILFLETFKTLNQEGKKLELADVENIDISPRSGREIPDEEKVEFKRIAEENWSKYFFKDEVMDEFNGSLENSSNRFYTVKYAGKIIAFIRFDPTDNCELYAGSLNVRPDLRGSTIGEALLKSILKKEAHNNTINAKVYSRLPILKRYIGEFGFVATNIIDNYHGREGEFGFKMLLAEEENQGYKLFNQPLKEIKEEHHDNMYVLNQPEIVLKFDSLNEREVMAGQCRKLLSHGYVLTAYRPEKEKTGLSETESVYLAFEKRVRRLEQAA